MGGGQLQGMADGVAQLDESQRQEIREGKASSQVGRDVEKILRHISFERRAKGTSSQLQLPAN